MYKRPSGERRHITWTGSQTLQLQRPFGLSLVLAALFLIFYITAGEAFLRFTSVRLVLGAPHLGSEHKQFEQQWFRLSEYAASRETIDCIFIGDSTVMTNFSPIPFADSYREHTGEEIDCFNFGVGAFTAEGLATLGQILVQEYKPRLLLVGLEALVMTVPLEEQGSANLSDTAWARYKLGEFTPEGWLYENVYFYRYLNTIGQYVTFKSNPNEVMVSAAGEIGGAVDGFFPMEGTGPFNVSEPPNPDFDHPYIEHYFAAMDDFQLLPENLEALDRILALNSASTRVILIEMPVPETFHAFFQHGEQDTILFIDTISNKAAAQKIPFWRMPAVHELPASVWFNYNHLNSSGAPLFSRWLGQELAQSLEGQHR
jgi:hypothetical protein